MRPGIETTDGTHSAANKARNRGSEPDLARFSRSDCDVDFAMEEMQIECEANST
jgi:hypothetical protein